MINFLKKCAEQKWILDWFYVAFAIMLIYALMEINRIQAMNSARITMLENEVAQLSETAGGSVKVYRHDKALPVQPNDTTVAK